MDKEEIRARVGKIQWFQNYELLPGMMTNGLKPIREEELATLYHIPQDLRGKRVLDIGCADGYYTFLAEERGASVVAIDSWPYPGFLLAHEVRGSKAEYHQMNVYDLQPSTLGTFDIVFFMGVYYHLKNPLLALAQVAAVTHELAIIESHVMSLPGFEKTAFSRFYEPEELTPGDPTSRWVPNIPCLLQTIRTAGFPHVEFIGCYGNNSRGIVHAYKGPRTAAKMLNDDFICTIHTPSTNAEVSRTIQVTGVALSKVEQADRIERIMVYLDKLDDPKSELGQAVYPIKDGSWQESIVARLVSNNFGPIGFEFTWDTTAVAPGQHTLYILVEGQRGWNYAAKPVLIKDNTSKFFIDIFRQEKKTELATTITHNSSSPQETTLEINTPAVENLSKFMSDRLTEIDNLVGGGVSLSTRSDWFMADQVRRAFHNLVIYYVNMLANKQKAVNQVITEVLKQMIASQKKIEQNIAALREETANLHDKVQALEAKEEKQTNTR